MSHSMNRFRKNCCASLVGIACLGLLGCSDKLPKLGTVPASGTVTYKGQPLEGAAVAFISTNGETGKNANAVTDSQGRFVLQTYAGGTNQASGAMPGDYIVTIQKQEASSGGMPSMPGGGEPTGASFSVQATGDPKVSQRGGEPAAPKLLTPAKYADAAKPEFTATVKPTGENTFTFDLVD